MSFKSSKGATSIIRDKLKFTDEHLWRKFSSRRLQLVDALSLSSKKASEQDEEIQICAKTLMQEFNFPNDTLGEFDKLVRLAIQSVRRNKKRSQKRHEISLIKQKEKSSYNSNSSNNNDDDDDDEEEVAIKRQKIDDNNHNNMKYLSLINSSDEEDDSTERNKKEINIKPEEQVSRLAVNSLIAPIIPETDRLPSLKQLYSDPKFHKSATKILQTIKKSRTCFEFSSNVKNNVNLELLEELGTSCINSTVLLTLERWFDHLLPDSSSYIKTRLKSNQTLSTIIKKLDSNALEVNGLNDYLAAGLFKRLIGACCKDFGFDVTLNPLCDIFHNTILKDFPILTRDPTGEENAVRESYFKNEKSIIDSIIPNQVDFPLSTSELPLPPPPPAMSSHHRNHNHHRVSDINLPSLPSLRQRELVTPVKIKFQQKELIFHYKNESNAPPTIMELISNCKNAFGIVNSTRVLHLRDVKTKIVFRSDFELERTLRMNSMWGNPNEEIALELIFTNVVQDYLNLNYEQKATSKDTYHKRESTPTLNMAPVINHSPSFTPKIISNHSISKLDKTTAINDESQNNDKSSYKLAKDDERGEKNHKNENDALSGRYLPLPRPQGPNANKRILMKFQPLL